MATQTSVKVANLTGAAKDDVLTADITGLTQNKLTGNLNVLLNDPGSAKLYSLIQDPSALASTATLPVVNSVTLASGAKISINPDGTIAYDASTLHTPLQSLAEGENYTDTFVYTIRMANGALSTAKVPVLIAGVNDAPTLAAVTPLSPAALVDTANWDTPAAINGKVAGADIDHGAVLSYSIASGGQSLTNGYGTLTIDAATGNYSFVADAAKFNSLAAGENATASFSVLVKDEHGAASAPVTLNFKLTGANDTASIDGNGAGRVAEDGTLGASGKLNAHDADHDQAAFQAPASLAGAYGDFTFNSATGDWTYTLRNGDANVQALNAGKVVSDEITVASVDGTATAKLHVE
ncbi:VCBS domain-containing protein, partial [Massilia terrae]